MIIIIFCSFTLHPADIREGRGRGREQAREGRQWGSNFAGIDTQRHLPLCLSEEMKIVKCLLSRVGIEPAAYRVYSYDWPRSALLIICMLYKMFPSD